MNVNELIDFNLNLLKDGLDIRPLELKNTDNEMLSDEKSLALFNKMISESLIFLDQFKRIQLSTRGYEIIDFGGWLIHLRIEKDKTEKAESKEILEIENLKLQNESSVYSKTLRQKEDEIRNLTRDNLRLGNWDIRFRWYIAVGGFIFGFITKYFIDK